MLRLPHGGRSSPIRGRGGLPRSQLRQEGSETLIAAERAKFIEGATRTGYGSALGTELFDIIEPFADYAFGKSHAYGYGLVAFQTAYLKAHHPVEYLACLLTSVKSSLEKAAVYIAECRALGSAC